MAIDDRDILELLKNELDFVEKGGYGRRRRQTFEIRPQSRIGCGLELAADVNLRCRILADEHDAEPRRSPDARSERVNLGRDLRADLIGDGRAVEDARGH